MHHYSDTSDSSQASLQAIPSLSQQLAKGWIEESRSYANETGRCYTIFRNQHLFEFDQSSATANPETDKLRFALSHHYIMCAIMYAVMNASQ